MADVEFSNYVEGLTSAGTPDGTEIVPVSQAGAAKRTTVQAIANKASIPASQISDSTSTGRSVLTAADAGAARTAIGAGTSSFSGAYADLSGKPTLGTAAALDVAASGDAASGEVVKGNDSRLSDSRAPTSAGLAATITGATSKTTPVDADEVPLADSAASYGLKKLTWANIKATAKAYFDTLYAAVSHTHAASDITSGTMATARLGSGTANNKTYLRGDQTWAGITETIAIACSDESSNLTTGTGKVVFRMPYAFTLFSVKASVTTAPTGSVLTVDINEGGTSILSTKLTIDAGEKTSATAATAAVISDSSLADDAEITIDIDGVGSTVPGAGLKVYLIGTRV